MICRHKDAYNAKFEEYGFKILHEDIFIHSNEIKKKHYETCRIWILQS